MSQIERRREHILQTYLARDLLTVFALLLSLFITYQLWSTESEEAEQSRRTAFQFKVRESDERIQQRLAIYEQVLRATLGMFRSAKAVSRQEFRVFVDTLELGRNYPGIQGIGFAAAIPAQERSRHEAAVRSEGFPYYAVKPADQRDFYAPIVYLEPFSGRNLRAFGYDMYSEPVRRAAMEKARDTGQAAITGKVTLVQEDGAAVQAGFLIYLPVYSKNAPHMTRDERRSSLVGWVYAPFRVNDFMQGVHGERADDLDIEIYDDGSMTDAGKLYDSHKAFDANAPGVHLRSIGRIESAQRSWDVVTAALPAFERQLELDRPQLVLRTGVGISLLTALLIWLSLDDRARALHAADQAMQLALYDALTGLPNRKLLDERLVQAVAAAKRHHGHVALLFIDLDKFKPVNDNFGHAYGDLLLKEVAKRLQSCMRASDTASRLGGDEFVALLTDIEGPHAVKTVATKVLQRLTEPYPIAGHVFDISASIGAALYPEHGSDGKTLMKNADIAMYAAKNSGRANVKFAPAA